MQASAGNCAHLSTVIRPLRIFFLAIGVFGIFCSPEISLGQTASKPRTIDPKNFGFEIPDGPVRQHENRAVRTRDEEGNDVIAKVHVQVGDNLIVMLPDGRLVARPVSEVKLTTELFTAESKESMAKRLTEDEFKGFRVSSTKRYLYLSNTSEPFTVAASRILETMFPGVMTYAEAQKIVVHEPEVPLVVVMFKDEEEYRRHTKAPPGMVAFYSSIDNRVMLYEKGSLAEIRPDLMVQQAFSTIAHEGAHQILHNIGVQQRLSVWPMWLSEGMAEFFAPTSTDSRLRWKGAGQVNDMRLFELEQYLKARPADADGKLFEDTVQAARLTSTGYATSWSIVHYLAKNHRVEFHKYVNEVSRLGPLEGNIGIVRPGIIPANREHFEKHFGVDYKFLEQRLINHLNKLPYTDPFAAVPHVAATITVTDKGKVRRDGSVFLSRELALKWQSESLEGLAEDVKKSAVLTQSLLPNKAAAQAFVANWLRSGR